MKFNRRHFCSALAIGSTGVFSETVSAQSEIRITGTIDSAVGADVEGVELFFQHVDTGWYQRYTIPASGDIDLTVPQTGEFIVRLDNTSARNENVPLLYSFGSTTVERTGTSVTYTIPQPYDVTIQCVDGTGTPIERLPIRLRTGGYSHAPGVLTTSERGYVTFNGTKETPNQPALQLSGPIRVEVDATGDTENQRLGIIDVVEDASFEFNVKNPDQYKYTFKIIEPDPDNGFHHPYLLYIPDVDHAYERPLYVEPLNVLETKDRSQLDRQLINSYQGQLFAGARRNRYPGIVAGFPRPPDDHTDIIQSLVLPSYRSDLLYENNQLEDVATEEFSVESLTRIDQQLLAMIADAKSRLASEPYPVADKIHMSGFSSSAHFSSRFAFLYPDEVRTITIGGYSLLTLPKESHNEVTLPYPLGTADYKELIGREFDKEAWTDINQYIYIGEEDQPSPDNTFSYYNGNRYENKAERVYGINNVTERFPFVRSQYKKATDNAEFEIFDGIGHSIDDRMETAIVDFHQQNSPTPNPKTVTEASESESSGSAPGFGIGNGIAALGGIGYMLRRQLTDDPE